MLMKKKGEKKKKKKKKKESENMVITLSVRKLVEGLTRVRSLLKLRNIS